LYIANFNFFSAINNNMSNLIPSTAKDIYHKIQLFTSYDPSVYFGDPQYSWIADDTITAYHEECQTSLNALYDQIAGDMAAIDENDTTSISLGPTSEDAFVMQPEDLTTYLAQGLTYEKVVTDSKFGKMSFDSIDMEVIDGGNTLRFTASGTLTNTDIHPFPYESLDIQMVIESEYWTTNLYRNHTVPTTITILNVYRGPADNIDDRGANYYDPIDIQATSLNGLEATNYFRCTGTIWDFDTQTIEVTCTFDNGATATLEFNIPFTVDFNAGKITADAPVVSNGTYLDFQGSITQPAYQWSDFTKTQSPNVLRQLEAIQTNAASPKTNLFIEAISDSVTEQWDLTIDALENGENLDKAIVVAQMKSDLYANKTVALAQDVSSIKRYAKTYLANRVFEANASYALTQLGITIVPSVSMTVGELSALNTALIAAGVTNFEENPGYYNWANIPECNSKDECARYATAVFSNVKDFSVMLEHPALDWISDNFDYIESEMLTVKTELNKVI
jgi:hypothetical protein